jgi:hypothetical protein
MGDCDVRSARAKGSALRGPGYTPPPLGHPVNSPGLRSQPRIRRLNWAFAATCGRPVVFLLKRKAIGFRRISTLKARVACHFAARANRDKLSSANSSCPASIFFLRLALRIPIAFRTCPAFRLGHCVNSTWDLREDRNVGRFTRDGRLLILVCIRRKAHQ